MRFFLIPVLLLITGVTSVVAKEEVVYRWTDKQGVTHYSDKKPDNQQVREVTLAPLYEIPATPSPRQEPVIPREFATPRQEPVPALEAETASEPSSAALTERHETELATDLTSPALSEGTPEQRIEPPQKASGRQRIVLYTWVDKQGVRHYSNQKPADSLSVEVPLGQPPANTLSGE